MTDDAPPTSIVLPAQKARFLTQGLDKAGGFLIHATAYYLSAIEYLQRDRVEGGICEIGVHRGKSFLAMTAGMAEGDPAVAIDIFDAQHLNMEATSENALRDFRIQLDKWDLMDRVDIMECSSLDLEAEGFLKPGRRFRLFSVDGGHLDYHVLNDLRIAEATLAEGGIVAADDLLNAHFLGVITGVFKYLDGGGTLVPFALIPNKLLLTDAASVESNRAMLRETFGVALTQADVPFHNTPIDVYGDIAWTIASDDGTTALLAPQALSGPEMRRRIAQLEREVQVLTQQRRRLRRKLREAREAIPNSRAERLPKPLRSPARAIDRALHRGR